MKLSIRFDMHDPLHELTKCVPISIRMRGGMTIIINMCHGAEGAEGAGRLGKAEGWRRRGPGAQYHIILSYYPTVLLSYYPTINL